jgi:hypothetical protein
VIQEQKYRKRSTEACVWRCGGVVVWRRGARRDARSFLYHHTWGR